MTIAIASRFPKLARESSASSVSSSESSASFLKRFSFRKSKSVHSASTTSTTTTNHDNSQQPPVVTPVPSVVVPAKSVHFNPVVEVYTLVPQLDNDDDEQVEGSSSQLPLLWYTRQELHDQKRENARQVQLMQRGQLRETDQETGLGLELDHQKVLSRCKRDYCLNAVLSEQERLSASRKRYSRSERARRIARAYGKVIQTFE